MLTLLWKYLHVNMILKPSSPVYDLCLYLPNAGCDTRSIFKQRTTRLNSKMSFS